ncbi:uncharacterized protein LOC128546277 [Mercenaria mercenaria]|uniref:uncharacterized protein LOC128546277 n=1 Tax=Mercenaria mercenaria TaxID=6596 RepID=UPI00234F809D|nr:uncharacterized protein LOC128546277 [Mercenaria mercenaria]
MERWNQYGALEPVWSSGTSMEWWNQYGVVEPVGAQLTEPLPGKYNCKFQLKKDNSSNPNSQTQNEMPKFYPCAVCQKRTKPKERRSINRDIKKYLQRRLFIETKESDIICNKCRHKYYVAETLTYKKNENNRSDPEYIPSTTQPRSKSTPVSPPSVSLNLKTTSKTHSRCLVCKRPGPKLVVLTSDARFSVFLEQNILIPAGSRCCPVHLYEGLLSATSLENVPVIENAYGFSDSLSLLEDLGIRAEMPSFINKGQKQMPCEDANNSRFVTKIRWVVESANARIKSWKYFNYVLPTNQIPYIGDYLRIVCALSNKYFQPLCSPHSEDGDTRLASRMLSLSSGGNTLKSYVEANNLERRSALWKPVSDVVLDNFPRFTEEQLRSLTCGVYQLKMSSSYIQEHLDGNCDIQVHADDNDLLRVWIQSRHTSSRKYLLWIRYSLSDIIAWYCKCRAGERVVGMCSHIASVVWYLSYARHLESNIYGVQNWGEYLADASKIPEPIDLSDSESEASIIEE